MKWAPEHEERLRALWPEGHSLTQTAKILNKEFGVSFTRNSVIGKAHRMKLPMRGAKCGAETSGISNRQRRAPPVPRLQHQNNGLRFRTKRPVVLGPGFDPKVKGPTPISLAEEGPGSATIYTLGAHVCRWPIGDPRDEGFTFCGAEKERGAYCAAHGAVAYQPLTPGQAKAQRAMVKHLARGFS